MNTNARLQEFPDEPHQNLFRGSSDQMDFEKEMKFELSIFSQMFEEALALTLHELGDKHPSYQNRNSKASRMNENIRGLLFSKFPESMRETDSGRFYFERRNKYLKSAGGLTKEPKKCLN